MSRERPLLTTLNVGGNRSRDASVRAQRGFSNRTALAILSALAVVVISSFLASTAAAFQKPKDPPKDEAAPPSGDESEAAERRKLSDLRVDEKLPRVKDLEVPTIGQLHERPVDWVLLKGSEKGNEFVIVANLVFPRPDTLRKLEASLDELKKLPRPATDEDREKLLAQRRELQSLLLTLPNDTEKQIYEIPTKIIDRFVYHEDLIIRRAGLLMDEKRFRDAYEQLYALERRSPDWNGLTPEIQRLLFLEAEDALQHGDRESALVFLEELHGRDRNYRLLQARLGEVVDTLIVGSRSDHDDRRARHFLARLARREPNHEIVAKWTNQFLAEARKWMTTALDASKSGRHDAAAAAIDAAVRVWPETPGLADAHRNLNERFQRLRIGVLDLAAETASLPFPTLADQRETRLMQFDLFEVDRIDDSTHYRTRLCEQWEPTDLGRRAVFSLRSTRARWESRPILTAAAVLATIASRLDPSNPAYDERLDEYIESAQLRSPFEFELRFTHVPPRTEPLFRFPVVAPRGAADSGSASVGQSTVLSRRFERIQRNERDVTYRRFVPQPDGLNEYRVAEVSEHKYDTPEQAVQGLVRGEVSVLADLPTWALAPLRGDPRFFILDYAIPTTHVLQFNSKSEPLRSRELRLALAHSIDALRVLPRAVLRDFASQRGRIVTAPFATSSYAYNPLVTPREFSTTIASSLLAAAEKRLSALPALRMICAPGVAARAAAAEIVDQWKRVGIKVDLVLEDKPEPAGRTTPWDIAYRTLRMEEPVVELWPFLTLDSRARLESLRRLPDWLRLGLLDLDDMSDWKSTVVTLQQLHADLFAQAEYLPLWEIDDSLVIRKNIRDFPPAKFVHAYQDVERWIIQSWFPEEAP